MLYLHAGVLKKVTAPAGTLRNLSPDTLPVKEKLEGNCHSALTPQPVASTGVAEFVTKEKAAVVKVLANSKN